MILLASETHENVKVGIQYFKNSIPYTLPSGRFIFFLDKDFDYINVFEEIFVGSVVLLCNVHTSRYFKEKVFTSKSYWGEIEDHKYFTGKDWEDLVTELKLVRDSPSMEIYEERERELLEMTKDLTVRPGQTVNSVFFKDII